MSGGPGKAVQGCTLLSSRGNLPGLSVGYAVNVVRRERGALYDEKAGPAYDKTVVISGLQFLSGSKITIFQPSRHILRPAFPPRQTKALDTLEPVIPSGPVCSGRYRPYARNRGRSNLLRSVGAGEERMMTVFRSFRFNSFAIRKKPCASISMEFFHAAMSCKHFSIDIPPINLVSRLRSMRREGLFMKDPIIVNPCSRKNRKTKGIP